MGLLSKLFGSEKNSKILSDQEIIEAGACPNCWGKQDYDGQFIDYEKDQTKSNINHDKQGKKAFVQQFVETNVTGIKLKRNGVQNVCPACATKYKHISEQTN